MADIPWGEIAEGIGQATGDTLVDMANTAADFFCDTYAQFPAAIVSSPLDNPGARFADGLARRICAPRNKLPPTPPAPPQGGQCPGVIYQVDWAFDLDSIGRTGQTLVPGPVGGITSRTVDDRKQVGFTAGITEPEAPDGFYVLVDTGSQETFNEVLGSAQLTNITRVDGLPDNCGNGFPTYPSGLPTVPSLVGKRPFPLPGVNVEVPIEINPVKFEVGVSIKPEFNINFGGIQINFDITGAKISIGPTFNIPPVLPPQLDPRNPKPPAYSPGEEGIGDPALADDIDGIKRALDDIKECSCGDEDGEGALLQELLGQGGGGVYNLPPRIEFVRLTLTSLPSNERVEYGNGTSQNVIYAGWYSFGTSQGEGDRNPVSYASNCFFAPKGATRFAYTVRKGASAVATAFYRAKPPQDRS